jgi:hypothetical protein
MQSGAFVQTVARFFHRLDPGDASITISPFFDIR